ncbi:Protein LONG AFTER FAR-RED 3 [Turnera subulata]|uniref:Protein LONG AFTER FAR-RED 3 n=1 Tax=Turnera subulata TaxID=218843 RepID=A0A9Q0GCB7_9ROSI|nr:Protein LONG AFTER FAR-RED 3 [Turnera subulata]
MNAYALLSAISALALALALALVSFPPLTTTPIPPPLQYWLTKPRESPPDLIVKNGVIFTSDASFPLADSFSVKDGKIHRVGNYSSIQGLEGDGTRVLDLEGKVVVPGFIDSHVHLIFGGLQMGRVELRGVDKKDEFVRRVKEAATNLGQGSWVLGGGWNNNLWGGEQPEASWIDDVSPHNPVWLSRMDGHMGLANSVALKLSGIDSSSENPNGGTIVKSAQGEPTGLLIDAAMKLVLTSIPEVSVEERREAMLRASNHALMRGVTTVVDVGRYFPGASVEHSWEDLSDVYQWADSSGKMKIRVCLFFPIETWSRLIDLIRKTGRRLSDYIYLGGVKAFADGSLGSNSALFSEPYIGEPHNYGLKVTDLEHLFNMTATSDNFGLQVAIHAIGDRANEIILDMYELVASKNGERDRRFRIEHAQHLSPGTATRFGEQRIIASVQPDHLLDDAFSTAKKLGADRAEKGSYLFRTLLTSNAQLALGSDWPVADINPLRSINTALKRVPPGWENAWNPSECISLSHALIAHTISAAHACFLDNVLGSLTPGKLADFVILSANSLDALEEGSASIVATYVAGEQAYP